MTHICVSRLTIIGLGYGLSPERHRAIIWTNVGILLMGPSLTNRRDTLIEILIFPFTTMRLKVSPAKWRPFRLGLNVLMITVPYRWLIICYRFIKPYFQIPNGALFLPETHILTYFIEVIHTSIVFPTYVMNNLHSWCSEFFSIIKTFIPQSFSLVRSYPRYTKPVYKQVWLPINRMVNIILINDQITKIFKCVFENVQHGSHTLILRKLRVAWYGVLCELVWKHCRQKLWCHKHNQACKAMLVWC